MSELLGRAWVEVRADMGKLRPDLIEAGDNIVGFFGNLKSQLSGMLPFASVAAGIALISNELRIGTEEALGQAEADKRLEAVLRATGEAAGLSADELREVAQTFQNMTGVAADEIENFQSILLTFRNVQGDTFNRATELALDMAAVFGGDLAGKAIQLGKALNDPIEGISALSRVGVTFTDQQKEMIKQLVNSGRGLEAQSLILDELEKQVGGAAQEMAKGPAGELKLLKAQLADVREELGNRLVPLLGYGVKAQILFAQAIGYGIDALWMISDAYQHLDEMTHRFISGSLGAAGAVLAIAKALPYLQVAAQVAIKGVSMAFATSVWGMPLVAIGAIVGGIIAIGHWLASLTPVQEAWTRGVERLWQTWKLVESVIMTNARLLFEAFRPALEWLGVAWDYTWQTINYVVGAAVAWIIDSITSLIQNGVEWFVVLSQNADVTWQLIKQGGWLAVLTLRDAFTGFFMFMLRSMANLGMVIVDIFMQIPTVISRALQGEAFDGVADAISQVASNAMQRLRGDLAKSFAPSEDTKQAQRDLAQTASQLYGEKLKLEGKRAVREVEKEEEKKFKRGPGAPQNFNKDKDKSKEIEGFFGPTELAKKFQEAMLKDNKTDKLIAVGEGSKKVQEDMLDEVKKMNESLGKNKLPIADA